VNRTVPSAAALVALVLFVSPFQSASPGLAAPPQATAPAPASPLPGAGLPNEKDSVKFGVIGDTGTGGSAQYAIAKLLSETRARFSYEFVIMLGDNMYGGESPSDFVRKFERPYGPILNSGVKFYATLGNHDEPTQRYYKLFNMDGNRYYKFRKGDVEFFVLDTTYMTPAQVNWVKDALQRSDAKWKIPYFHHPLYSSGEKHGSETDLRTLLEPLFVENGVDVVFAGHEHFYERLKPQKGIYYFTAGGSAKLRKGNIADRSPMTDKGFDTDNSFMLVEIAKDELFFQTISRKAQLVDQGTLRRREAASTN
jgi:predicted phosphodiesterase